MTGIKISALPAADAANDTDQLEVNQGGTSRRVTVDQLGERIANSAWIQDQIDEAAPYISATSFGAVGDWNDTTQTGTDNAVAINAALQYAKSIGGADVVLPVAATGTQANGTGYFTTQTIVVPERCRLIGPGTQSTISSAVRIVGALSLTPIVECDGGSGSRATGLINLAIVRANGTVPNDSVGVRVLRVHYAHLERVLVTRCGYAFHVASGLGIVLRECFSTIVHQAHVLWTGGPMLTLDQCSFGMSGLDVACGAYIRIDLTVGNPTPGEGADSLNCIRTQFNQSGPAGVSDADCLLDLINYRDPNGILNFTACHVEGIAAAGVVIKADAGSTAIRSITFSQTTIAKDTPGNFFNFNALASLRTFVFAAGSRTTFAMNLPASASGVYSLNGCLLLGGLSCAGASQLAVTSALINGDVAFSGDYATFALAGSSFVSSVFADTSTGNKYWAGNAASNGTPTIPEYFNGMVKFPEFGDCGGAVATHTGTVAKTALKTVTIPARSLGANGYLEVDLLWNGVTNNANAKTTHVEFGGVTYTTLAITTQQSYKMNTIIYNQNSVSAQVGQSAVSGGGGWGSGAGVAVTGAVNTNADANLVISATLASAADSITLAGYAVKAHYRP